MEIPQSHPDLEKFLKDQGIEEDALIRVLLEAVLMISLVKRVDSMKAMRMASNGLLAFCTAMDTFLLSPEGMAFSNWVRENPKEALKVLAKNESLKAIMKNRMN